METINIESLITDLAIILVLGAIATVLFKAIKQPVVLGYIVAGFLASPHFSWAPTVGSEAHIEFWAQLGIIVLLFSLGLEFSFKKLLNVGSSAVVPALIIVLGMMGIGFLVGEMLGFTAINSIFLGGMLSMSSTTIILKALTDLNMRQRRFVPRVFAVLIVEDLFAVVMLVILSSIAINKSVSGDEMVESILKLLFFLIIWFTVGMFVIPSIFKRFRRLISDELMLVISMGLCFLMAVFSVKSGFSLALGAFVMGSILAGTNEAERIERVITPVKDLFGAVFFISVGMMVSPHVIMQYAGTIALLSAVVVAGMIVMGTFGMLATGQPLKIAMEAGFSLTQIGEFSFIIATTGMSLGVLDGSIYPIIVAVSVITTFFTPFFIKRAIPCYEWVAKHLPKKWDVLLNGYSANAAQSEVSETRALWSTIVKRYLMKLAIYSALMTTIIVFEHNYLQELVSDIIPGTEWNNFGNAAISILLIMPFLYALARPSIRDNERAHLVQLSGKISYVPLVVITVVNVVVSLIFTTMAIYGIYSSVKAIVTALVLVTLLTIALAPLLNRHVNRLEKVFLSNVNTRENRRTGKEQSLVSDLHLAYMRVGYGCEFVGEKLRNASLRNKHGINLVNIQRGAAFFPVPSGDMRIFPGDVLGVIGTEEQILHMLPIVEADAPECTTTQQSANTKFMHFTLTATSPIIGKTLLEARLREDYSALLVSVERNQKHTQPHPQFTFAQGDTLWLVGDPKTLAPLA